jgi:RNA polymerase sigma-70 factor, ECF subfamily
MPGRLLEQARAGDAIARGELLELYRNYLRLVARSLISTALRVKLDPSDLVQETFLKAHREFTQFAGRGEPELVAWLRRILVTSLANQVKHHRRRARDHQRQDYREAFIRRTLEHVSFETMAADMGRSVGAVRMLWARAVKRLTELLGEDA